jgi:hypothetical protein
MDRIGWVLRCLFGQGGGLRLVVFRAGVCLLLLDQCRFRFGFLLGQGGGRGLAVGLAGVSLKLLDHCWFRFRFLLGQGGGRDRVITYGVGVSWCPIVVS